MPIEAASGCKAGLAIRNWRPHRRKPGSSARLFPPMSRKRSRDQIVHHGGLKPGNEGESARAAKRQQIVSLTAPLLKSLAASGNFRLELRMRANVVQHGGLDSAEAEIVSIALYFHRGEIQSISLVVEVRALGSGSCAAI